MKKPDAGGVRADDSSEETPVDFLTSREYTRKDILKMYKITSRTLARWIARGDFPPPMKVGMWERWDETQIAEWKRKLLEEVRTRRLD